MTRYRYSKHQKLILSCITIVGLLTYYGKDKLYFNNGSGGTNWKIGNPQTNFINANNERTLPELRQQALLLVNRDRQLNNLKPLIEDPLISLTAQKHSEDMAKRDFYNHTNPEGQTPTDRYHALGGKGGIGENIMYQGSSPYISLNYGLLEIFQKSWMYSKGHRDNLLTPDYTKFGFGITTTNITGKIYAVQNFQ